MNAFPKLLVRLQNAADFFGLSFLVRQLDAEFFDFQRRNSIQRQIQNSVGLDFVELTKRRDQLGTGVRFALTFANDLQSFIKSVEDDDVAFENMNSLFELPQLVLEPLLYCDKAEVEEMLQHLVQTQHSRHHRSVFRNQRREVVREV